MRPSNMLVCLLLLGVAHEPLGSRSAAVEVPWNAGSRVVVPERLAAIVRGADRATLYRVAGEFSDEWKRYRNAPRIAGHPKIAAAPIPAATIPELGRVLTASTSYLREHEAWTCLPQPFYLMRFERGCEMVDVVIHECGAVEMKGASGGQWSRGLRAGRAEGRLWTLLRGVIASRPNCCG